MGKEQQANATGVSADVKNTAVSTNVIDFGADAGAGFEGATAESFAIPFLAVLQTNSPQVDEAEGKYIPGAKAGQLFNSVNSRLYDGKTGLIFLMVAYQRRFVHWGARSGNGGFRGEYLPEKAMELRDSGRVVELDGKLYFPNAGGEIDPQACDRLSDTRNHFGIVIDPTDGSWNQVLMSLSSTQIKKSKQLMQMLNEVRVKGPKGEPIMPPSWYSKVRITTMGESNEKGKWYGIKPTLGEGFIEDVNLYNACKGFHDAIKAGTAGAAQYVDPDEGSASEGSF